MKFSRRSLTRRMKSHNKTTGYPALESLGTGTVNHGTLAWAINLEPLITYPVSLF